MKTILMIAMMISLTAAFAIGQEDQGERGERRRYSQLIKEMRNLQSEYRQVVDLAMQETDGKEGQAPPHLLAKIMDVRDEFRRKFDHALLISLRWGWEMPADLSLEDSFSKKGARAPITREQEIFKPAQEIVRARFVENSKLIARKVYLPVVSISRKAGSGGKK